MNAAPAEPKPLVGLLVGGGFFAQFHIEAWKRVAGVRIAGLVDPDLQKAEAFAETHGIERVYTSLQQAVADGADFVDIATRPETHLSLTSLAAAAGLHVICQKPMAPQRHECIEMCEVCERHGVRLLIHENWRWQPWFRRCREMIDDGAVGRVIQLSFFWRAGDGRGPQPYTAQPYFRQMPRLQVYESLVHMLDTFRYLHGEIRSVFCLNRRVNPAIVGEDQTLIQVEFEDDTLGLIDGNRITGPHPASVTMGTMTIEGEAGTIRMLEDGRLRHAPFGTSEQAVDFDPPDIGYRGDSVRATQQHLVNCLRSGEVAESEGRDYLRTVALVDACYESARQGRAVQPVTA